MSSNQSFQNSAQNQHRPRERIVWAFSKILSGQHGFTLVEILIAVAILAVVSAIAIPAVGSLMGNSETKAESGELANIQSAVDALMADQEMEIITAVTTATNDMAAGFPGAAPRLSPGYLRQSTTRCNYTVTASGVVTQATCP